MIALGLLHQMSQEVLGHYVVHNVTKFQNCRSNNFLFLFFSGKKPLQKHFDKNNNTSHHITWISIHYQSNKISFQT